MALYFAQFNLTCKVSIKGMAVDFLEVVPIWKNSGTQSEPVNPALLISHFKSKFYLPEALLSNKSALAKSFAHKGPYKMK